MKKTLLLCTILLFGACNSEQGVKSGMKNLNESPLLTKYIIGKPNLAYFDSEKRVASRWGIKIKHVFAGSKNRAEIEKERLKLKDGNEKAYAYYEKKFGDDWQSKFKEEVKKEKK